MRSPDLPARSELLYRLRYPGCQRTINISGNYWSYKRLTSVSQLNFCQLKSLLTSMSLICPKLILLITLCWLLFPIAQQPLVVQRPPHYPGFTIAIRHTPLSRTRLEEWSARRRELCPTTHDTHKRQTSMPPAEFEPTIPASERQQTHALDRAATGIGVLFFF
jgi:hypothetical protein